MDFAMSVKAVYCHQWLSDFMMEYILPVETNYGQYHHEAGPQNQMVPPIIEKLKTKAKERGLWNLFLPAKSGLANLKYAQLTERIGGSLAIGPESLNCAKPGTSNIEILYMLDTDEHRTKWLQSLLDGEIRSTVSILPETANNGIHNTETTISRNGGDYIANGRKWWMSKTTDPRCQILITIGRTNPDTTAHHQQSMILTSMNNHGVKIIRLTSMLDWQYQHGRCELVYNNARVPTTNLLGEEGSGFAIAQARLRPGHIHHYMRALGGAERALVLMVDHVRDRVAFGCTLTDQSVVQHLVAKSHKEIDQVRLLCEKATWTIYQHGNKTTQHLVAVIKAVALQVTCYVINHEIQVHGTAGVSDDAVLARLYTWHSVMRFFSGLDEVHMRSVARVELEQWTSPFAVAVT
ncbi:acyl-CoA dehydrogenase [Mycobacterium uberis]|uniref:Acyl-CoA dehydrogenase n=1 Tax=Mycobacterium uberis TaxID=2162698 RepID=A0A3E1HIR4_9MYCO|nr:acyl-CoA dehydrogenase family protein [Mycobacterium uberis]RFD26361.1 acyl-CoA dehydrogenase [Mycobacterium uberis]